MSLKSVGQEYIDKHLETMERMILSIDSQISDKQDIIHALLRDIENLKIVRQGYKQSIANIRVSL